MSHICTIILETEKVSLVPPRSPCLTSSAAHTIQRQQRTLPRPIARENELSPSSSPEECRDHRSTTSIVPIIRPHTRPQFTPSHTLSRRHATEIDTEDSYFPPMQTPRGRSSNDLRKKVHGIYVLPVSPALSSSSSTTTNTDEMTKNSSNTMPIRALRHISSSVNVHGESMPRGIKNDSFADSPQPKDRTLPRSHGGTLRRIQAPAQPPPLPPPMAHQHHLNNGRSFVDQHDGQPSTNMDLDADAIALRFSCQKIYGTHAENQMARAPPPPVPCRAQKPNVLPIGFEGLNPRTMPSDIIGFRMMAEPSPHEDHLDHAWPKPPESMTTSEISGPPQTLPPSIPYDRLHHDHLIPTVLMRQNSSTNFFQHARFDARTMFSESET